MTMAVQTANTIGPYEIRGKILGRSRTHVYLAWDAVHRRRVVLKRPHIPSDASPKERRQACYELTAEAQLQTRLARVSRHILPVLDVLEVEGKPLVVQEYAAHGTLRDVLLPQSETQVIRWGIQLCEALEAAHRHNVLHRDVKSENVLLSGNDEVKLANFDIAVEAKVLARQMEQNRDAAVPGTVEFLAPEIWDPSLAGRARPEATVQTDLYAVGVVLYEVATGGHPYELHLPFAGPAEAMVKVCRERRLPRDPRKVDPRLSRAFADVLLRAVARRPAKRFATCQALRAALAGLANPEGARPDGDAGPKDWRAEMQRSAKRRRLLIAFAYAVSIVAFFGLIYAVGW